MISVIITTYNEPKTLLLAIKSVLNQDLKQEYEILVIGPDQETEKIVKKFNHPHLKYLKDEGKGKPRALNIGFKKAKGEILILTDGDVRIKENVFQFLLKPFEENKCVGAVTGRPISLNSKNNLFGYWSHFLTAAAHQWRLKEDRFSCSGYLYAFRNIIKKIPDNVLAEDGIITQIIRESGYQIFYAPEAEVYVKYPDNLKDWLKQKIRSAGGYMQKLQITNSNSKLTKKKNLRSFFQETIYGVKILFTYPKTIKEFWWTILLYLTRVYLWLRVFWEIRIKQKELKDIWQRVESTK